MNFREILMVAASQRVAASGGGAVELWPQPDFASSAGVTLAAIEGTTPTISGGLLTFFDDSDATASATALATLTTGFYNYSITIASITGGGIFISLAGGAGASDTLSTVGTHNGQIEVASVLGQDIVIPSGFTAATISHFSLSHA